MVCEVNAKLYIQKKATFSSADAQHFFGLTRNNKEMFILFLTFEVFLQRAPLLLNCTNFGLNACIINNVRPLVAPHLCENGFHIQTRLLRPQRIRLPGSVSNCLFSHCLLSPPPIFFKTMTPLLFISITYYKHLTLYCTLSFHFFFMASSVY